MLMGKPLPRRVGYTHVVSWNEQHKTLGQVQKSFPTTKCALKFHLENMQSNPCISDIKVKPYVKSTYTKE